MLDAKLAILRDERDSGRRNVQARRRFNQALLTAAGGSKRKLEEADSSERKRAKTVEEIKQEIRARLGQINAIKEQFFAVNGRYPSRPVPAGAVVSKESEPDRKKDDEYYKAIGLIEAQVRKLRLQARQGLRRGKVLRSGPKDVCGSILKDLNERDRNAVTKLITKMKTPKYDFSFVESEMRRRMPPPPPVVRVCNNPICDTNFTNKLVLEVRMSADKAEKATEFFNARLQGLRMIEKTSSRSFFPAKFVSFEKNPSAAAEDEVVFHMTLKVNSEGAKHIGELGVERPQGFGIFVKDVSPINVRKVLENTREQVEQNIFENKEGGLVCGICRNVIRSYREQKGEDVYEKDGDGEGVQMYSSVDPLQLATEEYAIRDLSPRSVFIDGTNKELKIRKDAVWLIDPVGENRSFNLNSQVGPKIELKDRPRFLRTEDDYYVFRITNDLTLTDDKARYELVPQTSQESKIQSFKEASREIDTQGGRLELSQEVILFAKRILSIYRQRNDSMNVNVVSRAAICVAFELLRRPS